MQEREKKSIHKKAEEESARQKEEAKRKQDEAKKKKKRGQETKGRSQEVERLKRVKSNSANNTYQHQCVCNAAGTDIRGKERLVWKMNNRLNVLCVSDGWCSGYPLAI